MRGNVCYVGCVGQIFTWVAWVTWVKIFFTWVAWVRIFLRGSLRGSKFFTWIQNFCVSQILFTRWYYFTRLVLSRQILTKPCLTSLVFLSRLLAKVDLGPVQHFRWRLLWHCLKADYLLKKELCLECCRDLYTPKNAINILQLGKIYHQTNSVMTFN